MSLSDRQLLIQGLRLSFPAFIQRVFQTVSPGETFLPSQHIEAIAHYLLMCAEGKGNRLAITMPPRHLKSICASVALPAWILGHDSTRQIINICYSQELSETFSRHFRTVVNSDWYQAVFPKMRPSKDTEQEFVTTQGGFRFTTSVGGTLTGRGGNLIIIDDPIKPEEAMSKTSRDKVNDWYRHTLVTRANNKNDDNMILVMQRLHVDDLVGRVLENEAGDWTHLDLPAIAQETQDIPIGTGQVFHRDIGDILHPQRESSITLDRLRRNLGSEVFSAQYLQRPVPDGGNMIKRDWFQVYYTLPEKGANDRIIQSWDTAMKPDQRNDPSVCTTWLQIKGSYYLIDVTRERLGYPELKKLVITHKEKFRADVVIIEDKSSGTSLIQDLQRDGSLHPIAFKPEGDKSMRMYAQTAKIEANQVHLPNEAPWLATFLAEVLAFPGSSSDDQVDSLSQFLKWIGDNEGSAFEADWGYQAEEVYWDSILSLPSRRVGS